MKLLAQQWVFTYAVAQTCFMKVAFDRPSVSVKPEKVFPDSPSD